MILRDDISLEANIARRLFWEKCASRTPIAYQIDVNHETSTRYMMKEDSEDVAMWADQMLAEWDKRWIAEEKMENV